MNDDNAYNAGGAGAAGSGDDSGQGGQDNNGAQNNATPGNQNGSQQPDPRDAEIAKYKDQNRILNQRLVDERRTRAKQPNGQQNAQDGDYNPFETPEGQYAMSIKAATADLRGRLESDILSEYPELAEPEFKQILGLIRRNPWTFATDQSYFSANVDDALIDIEQYLANEVEAFNQSKAAGAGANGGQQTQQNQGNANTPSANNPAQINNNSAAENEPSAAPGTTEDENEWTMPLDKLAKKKEKFLRTQQTRTA